MKILIIAACLVNVGDDAGGQHAEQGDMPDVPKDVAVKLVGSGRALYINKADDPDKAGANTASKDLVQAAYASKTAKEKAAKAAAAGGSPQT